MNILIASDSFKDSLTSSQVCAAIEQGLERVFPYADLTRLPIADGGEGTLQAISNVRGGKYHRVNILDALNNPISAEILELEDCVLIEIASACGLEQLRLNDRDPLITSSYGVGQLICAALTLKPSKIYICLGGSSTNDGGAGMLAALGARFINANDKTFVPSGGTLSKISSIDPTNLNPLLKQCEIIFASDVITPLYGESGATYMFAEQKGAKPQDLDILEKGLLHLADKLVELGGLNIRSLSGSGAAGGMAISLLSLYESDIISGVDLVLDLIKFDELLQNADIVITGEGKVDGQTQYGKAPTGVGKRAKSKNIPVILLCGAMAEGYESVYQHNIDVIFSATPEVMALSTAIEHAQTNLTNLAENVARLIKLNSSIVTCDKNVELNPSVISD